MCAVFGGVYCLRRTAQHLVFDNSDPAQRKCVGVIDTTGLKLKSKWVVMEASYVPDAILPTPLIKRHISRGILITDRSLQPDTSENITLLRLPAGQCGSQPITVLELSSLSLTVPKDLYIVHLTSSSVTTAKEDFSEAVDLLFHQDTDDDADNRPVILWSAYFNVADTTGIGHHNSVLADQNLLVLSGPNADLDFDHPIEEARAVFEKMCPGEEFLPKAPNPEDIIYNDGEGNQAKESGFEPETPSEASTAETPATASATPEVTTLTETTEDASKSATDKSTDKGENYRESEKETDIMEVLQEDGTSQTFRDAGEVKSPAPKEEASEQSTVIESAPQENTQNKESIS